MDPTLSSHPVFSRFQTVILTSGVRVQYTVVWYMYCTETSVGMGGDIISSFEYTLSLSPPLSFSLSLSLSVSLQTLSPIDIYCRLLDFHPVTVGHFSVTLAKPRICPLVSESAAPVLTMGVVFFMVGVVCY